MPHDPYKALYIHVPFCVSRCHYCDFHSSACAKDDACLDSYTESCICEIRKLASAGELSEIETAYIGGGTPTHLGNARLTSILYALGLSAPLTKNGFELTVEANPESLTERMVYDLYALGVNRISLGVQSFDDAVLLLLGRAHTAHDAQHALEVARLRFANISIDLMCGIPGQSSDSLKESVCKAIDADIPHISLYPLSIEPHTQLYRRVQNGTFDTPDEDEQADHLELAHTLLTKAGYIHYEVSNYALPGFQSKHNSVYWGGVPYLGIGEGATTMTQNSLRRMRISLGEVVDDLDEKEMAAEDLMLGMRLMDGVDHTRISRMAQLLPNIYDTLEDLVDKGLLKRTEFAYQPTQRGWLLGNELYAELLDLALS